MPETVTLLLVDDQKLLREGTRALLNMKDDLTIVGEAGDGREAVDLYFRLRPDVVLMDVQMPKINGVEATRRIRERDACAKVILLTTFDDDAYIFEGVRVGAMGYLLKTLSAEELVSAVRAVHRGGAFIEPTVARKLLAKLTSMLSTYAAADLVEPLSERELEILCLIADGLSNRKIAAHLNLAEGTVKNYVSSLLRKLNVQDRTQAALFYRHLRLSNAHAYAINSG